jgi:hypothetical protein
MALNMTNSDAASLIDTCDIELLDVKQKINSLNVLDDTRKYLTKYALMKCCGTIEQAFKIVLYEEISNGAHPRLSQYLEGLIRKSSMNPSLDNMKKSLKWFDDRWKCCFTESITEHPDSSQLKSSMDSLNGLRNTFAHGNEIQASISMVEDYYSSAKIVLDLFEQAVKS